MILVSWLPFQCAVAPGPLAERNEHKIAQQTTNAITISTVNDSIYWLAVHYCLRQGVRQMKITLSSTSSTRQQDEKY